MKKSSVIFRYHMEVTLFLDVLQIDFDGELW